jgi:hypothetical protein
MLRRDLLDLRSVDQTEDERPGCPAALVLPRVILEQLECHDN